MPSMRSAAELKASTTALGRRLGAVGGDHAGVLQRGRLLLQAADLARGLG